VSLRINCHRRREHDFVELDPNQFFGVYLEEPITDFVNSPGTYEFVVLHQPSLRTMGSGKCEAPTCTAVVKRAWKG